MRLIKSIGFPKMHKEESEKRDFLPEFFKDLMDYQVDLFLEEGYGERLGYSHADYVKFNNKIKFISPEKVFENDMIIVLRCPEVEEINLIKEDSILISMLHYETRETRNKLLKERKINCFSMDAMTNDDHERILVNYRGTSRAGSRIAFEELKKRTENFSKIKDKVINVSIIGAGAVAANSAKAFEEFGDKEFLSSDRGIMIHILPRTITQNEEFVKDILSKTDILVDASKRPDSSKIIIRNGLISNMPDYAIILDLAADPYNESVEPIQVKGIEGIPTGTLDKFVMKPDDEMFDGIPETISSYNRRVVVSCNAWPGIDARDCMELYGRQLTPFIDVLLSKPLDKLDISSRNMYERSLVRSSLDYFLNKTDER
ncbi:MAG: alanine dehydrogenase [Eubacteriales bacterium]|nr:alanine dehydrogenase [Eubacteriales bacterium]